VRGTARLDAHAARAHGKLVLSGTALDDVDRPIARVNVALTLRRSSSGEAVGVATSSPEPCSEGAARPVLERADLLTLPTDDGGRFCVRLGLATDRYMAHFEARTADMANGLLDAAATDLPIDLALESITLRFDPEQPLLSLDEAAAIVQVVASVEEDGVTAPAPGLTVVLSSETGATLGTTTTDAVGRARFLVPGDSLGPPGPGELRVSFAGNAQAGASAHTMRVEKHTRVDLSAPDAIDGRLPAGSPEEGIALRIVARPRCASRARAAVAAPTGAIEARLEETDGIVGAATLEGAHARVIASFPMPTSPTIGGEVLRIRYVPDAPWFVPSAELRLEQPIRPPSAWTRFPLLIAGALVLLWLFVARSPHAFPARSRSGKMSRAPRDSAVRPHVSVVRPAAEGEGWTGRVVDGHEGYGVPNARVSIERRGFERVETVAQALTDDLGRFALPAMDILPGDELAAEGALHGGLRQGVPPAGELQVVLILRKRALLERLVRWARRRGQPFDARPEPTPGHVRRAAGSEFAVARWADAVERAAYGGSAVDRDVQAEVDRLAPPDVGVDAGQPKPSASSGSSASSALPAADTDAVQRPRR
jgi:hypothetical protein